MFVLAALFGSAASASPVVLILSEWEGSANPIPCVCPALESVAPSTTHEFTVPSLNGSLSVRIDWQADLIADLDLYVERLVNGAWTLLGASARGQIASPMTPASEEVVLTAPPAGTYRARVANFLSTQTAYTGRAWFFTNG